MDVFVEGRQVPVETVGLMDGSLRGGVAADVVRLTVRVPRREFVGAAAGFYRDYSADDVGYGKDASACDVVLRRLGWPSLDMLWGGNPEALVGFARENGFYLVGEVLAARKLGVGARKYYVCDVDAAWVVEDVIFFDCRAVRFEG